MTLPFRGFRGKKWLVESFVKQELQHGAESSPRREILMLKVFA
jgi:hypothetical protein